MTAATDVFDDFVVGLAGKTRAPCPDRRTEVQELSSPRRREPGHPTGVHNGKAVDIGIDKLFEPPVANGPHRERMGVLR